MSTGTYKRRQCQLRSWNFLEVGAGAKSNNFGSAILHFVIVLEALYSISFKPTGTELENANNFRKTGIIKNRYHISSFKTNFQTAHELRKKLKNLYAVVQEKIIKIKWTLK